MKNKVKKLLKKRPGKNQDEQSLVEAIQNIPRITNETVAEHREEVLGSARKFIYPLQHSTHKVLLISITLLSVVVIGFFAYCLLALYKFNSSSTFLYRVTQVIPFPVAKAGPSYVAYENYLFELRHYTHYYQTQQRVDFADPSGKRQLAEFRKRALQIVTDYAYVKQLAKQNHVSVSDAEVNDAITLVRSQNRLGSSDQVFADVLKEFWGWSVNDFKRELRQQMLAQKVVSVLDKDTHKRANDVLVRVQHGEDFGGLAKMFSEDPNTRPNGGDYGFWIDKSDRNLSPQVIDTLFKLQPGGTSGIVNNGTGLEILQLKEVNGTKVRAAHILFNFKSINTYTDPLRAKKKPLQFIHS